MASKKTSYNEMQSLDKGRILRWVIISVVIFIALVAIAVVLRGLKKEETTVEAPETVTTAMVPSTIKYYDPGQEKAFDTGVDYIILSDGDQHVKVDSAGNVSYVSDDGQTIGFLSGEDRDAWITQAVTIMQSDQQAAMALSGLESYLPEQVEEESKPQTSDEALRSLLERMGISYEEFIGKVYKMGSTLDDVYTMLWMYEDDEAVINSIMEARIDEPEETPKSISVTVEKLGDSSDLVVSIDDSGYEYPSWMQTSDPTASMTALVESLNSISAGTSTGTNQEWENVNQQSGKSSWLDSQQEGNAGYSTQLTKWDLAWGSVIPLTLETGLNTDLPGNVIAVVRSNIYDSLTGTNLLIPKGSKVIATYNNGVSFGQTSVQIAWTQLITPDGYVYDLPGFQGISQEGYAGVKGKTNNHFWSVLGGAILGSIVKYSSTVATSTVQSAAGSVGNDIVSGYATNVAGSATDTLADYGTRYTNMWMNLQPTIKIATGAQIQMLVNSTVSFKR